MKPQKLFAGFGKPEDQRTLRPFGWGNDQGWGSGSEMSVGQPHRPCLWTYVRSHPCDHYSTDQTLLITSTTGEGMEGTEAEGLTFLQHCGS